MSVMYLRLCFSIINDGQDWVHILDYEIMNTMIIHYYSGFTAVTVFWASKD